MPSPCTVCLRPDRAAIDQRLATETVNLAGLARTLGVGRKALERHRDRHVPSQLADVHEYANDEDALPLLVELCHLYDRILDALATAECATLSHIDARPDVHAPPSHASIADSIKNVRYHVGLLSELFLNAALEGELAVPLDSQVRATLARVIERAANLE